MRCPQYLLPGLGRSRSCCRRFVNLSPLLVRMHPRVRRDLTRFGQLDHLTIRMSASGDAHRDSDALHCIQTAR